MTLSEFERIKSKISKAKDNANRAKGALDRIKQQWNDDFGIHSVEECNQKIESLTESIESDEAKKEKLMDKLEHVVDWSTL